MKVINYKVKSVTANTEYREVSPEDKKWVLDQAQRILDLENECTNSINSDLRSIGSELRTPSKHLIRQGTGAHNSIKSLCDGVVNNMVKGSQRDFSNRTCKGLEEAFIQASEIFTSVEEVKFIQGEVNDIQAMDTPQSGTTYSEIFDVQVYEVTVKRVK